MDDFDDLIHARDVFAFVLEASGHGPLASDRLMFMRTSEALVTTVLLVSRRERPMSDALFYEFTGVSAEDYKAVNAILGLDPATGGGDWPVGLLSHTGAAGPSGGFIVFELWDSRESQGAWMASRLGPALGQAGYASRHGSSGCQSWGTTTLERSESRRTSAWPVICLLPSQQVADGGVSQ